MPSDKSTQEYIFEEELGLTSLRERSGRLVNPNFLLLEKPGTFAFWRNTLNKKPNRVENQDTNIYSE